MKQQPDRKQRFLTSLSKLDLQKLYLSEHRPSHHQKWNDFADAYPELARKFLIRSNFVRDGSLDKGDAYLHAAADLFMELKRMQTIHELRNYSIVPKQHKNHDLADSQNEKGNVTCNVCSGLG
ncbi:MAG TPA: hypothetical protein VLG47_01755 [Candidatus Saccharimonadales bacterium]|nr:hypothetical protein [Candidatus Saccharimonadales bacterium]